MAERAIVLLSGGMDSATALAIAKSEGFSVTALTFDYGQRHSREIDAAKRVAAHFGVRDHRIVKLDLGAIGGSSLTDKRIRVPEQRRLEEIGTGIPTTYVPARNTILLSYALGLAEAAGAKSIVIAANAVDYSVDADARVWVKTASWAKIMPINELVGLPEGDYQTAAVDPRTLQLGWRRVTGRYRHRAETKRCFSIELERGQEITITEDHSLFTIDPISAAIVAIRGSQIAEGTPIAVPFDLSPLSKAWEDDLPSLDLGGLPTFCRRLDRPWSIGRENGFLTNRLRRTRVPVRYPVTDDLLYVLGLWLAEGGKERTSRNPGLAFSVGGTPGAAETLQSYFGKYHVNVSKSPANDYDYRIWSSVFTAVFDYLGLFGTSKKGEKAFPPFFWDLSQRQRRTLIAGLWDGDGGHAFRHESAIAQKSHALIRDLYHCFALDGIFPVVGEGRHRQRMIAIGRADDFRRFVDLYPLRHPSKRSSLRRESAIRGRDKTVGLWKCQGLWDAVSAAPLPPGTKTAIYNRGGKYDEGVRTQRWPFDPVRSLRRLVESRLAFLRVAEVKETRSKWMYDLSVEGAENFLANGILAHNSGYPDCRPEFYKAFQEVARLGTKRGVEGDVIEIRTPLISMSKADIVRKGEELGVPWKLTWSCYKGGEKACGVCDSCQLRLKGFKEAGVKDPLPYARPRKVEGPA